MTRETNLEVKLAADRAGRESCARRQRGRRWLPTAAELRLSTLVGALLGVGVGSLAWWA